MNLDRFSVGLADPQEAWVMARCKVCGSEIYEGEHVFIINSQICCENCVEPMQIEEFLGVG